MFVGAAVHVRVVRVLQAGHKSSPLSTALHFQPFARTMSSLSTVVALFLLFVFHGISLRVRQLRGIFWEPYLSFRFAYVWPIKVGLRSINVN